MNAAIRAVVRQAAYHGIDTFGVGHGFEGLIRGDFRPLAPRDVGDIIHRGGTILRTARSERFRTPAGQEAAREHLRRAGIDGLIVIGGNGSLAGALALHRHGLPVCGIPGTIDNDVPGTERSIGFDTAVNTVVEAINRIRDTATSHERTFVVEVMGRDSGWIALAAGLAGGAETVLVPERPVDYDEVCRRLLEGFRKGKAHSIIVVAEGVASGYEVARRIVELTGLETRVTVLGHIQRGGTPTAADRMLAARLGAAAVDCLRAGHEGHLLGIAGDQVVHLELETALKQAPALPMQMVELAEILAT
ncbi:MAG TPA: 6-phosphofructokinase [Bacillota bacterium]